RRHAETDSAGCGHHRLARRWTGQSQLRRKASAPAATTCGSLARGRGSPYRSTRLLVDLPCDPDLFARPAPRPADGHDLEPCLRAARRPNLDQVLEREAGRPQEPNPVAVREMELHGFLAR